MSHDFRTPLASIVGAVSSLQTQHDKLGDRDRASLLAKIDAEARHLASVTENTLQWARLSGSERVLRADWESIEEIVGSVLARVRRRDPDRRVKAEVPGGLPLVRADAVLLAQLMENLIDNALKYSDGPVQLSVHAELGEIHVQVLDRGPGIPDDDLPRIFDMFYRGSSVSSVRGAGLGLAVGRSIARSHGGTLTAHPRAGGGTCFRLALPAPASPSVASEAAPMTLKVLVVEDDREIRGLLMSVLAVEAKQKPGRGDGHLCVLYARAHTTARRHTACPMDSQHERSGVAALTLGALGVVYGDIGTSPLYTMKEVFGPHAGVPLDPEHIVGAASVILWALMLVVTLKYVVLILRANNRGEGGIMALTALAAGAPGTAARRRTALLLLGVFGAALFYGDSVITPAISVLGAMEGLEVVTPALEPYVVPASVAILVALFAVQRHGTAAVGKLFGPVIGLWFATLAVTGTLQILQEPAILQALNPLHAWQFLHERGWRLFAAVGAIVLALTGAEALYADMGHFGAKPIRLAWTGLVLPSLALNYLGQGALLMRDPAALANPFYLLFPDSLLIPAVILSACASVIASQAVISGAYSMTRQAIQLGFLPRMQVLFTSAREEGQIYMPLVNAVLLIVVLLATIGFGSTSAIAGAYGIAVTLTMLITTVLTYFVVRHVWRYPLVVALGATGLFLFVDAVLVVSCLLKFWDGGWFPLILGLCIFAVMATWKRGRELLLSSIGTEDPELLPFVEGLGDGDIPHAPRTAVYAVANPHTVPQALMHNLKHNRVLHDQNVILTVEYHDAPWVADEARVEVQPLAARFWQVRVHYGFKDLPDIPRALELCRPHGLAVNLFETSYFLSRETVVPTPGAGMARWREQLFASMSRNASGIAEFFRLPNNSVIELGTRVQI